MAILLFSSVGVSYLVNLVDIGQLVKGAVERIEHFDDVHWLDRCCNVGEGDDVGEKDCGFLKLFCFHSNILEMINN
jgi:hypothetical protein